MKFTKKMENLQGERTFKRFLKSAARVISINVIDKFLIWFALNARYG